MSSSNVLPSAPEYRHDESPPLYPVLPVLPNAENFRLTKISDLEKTFETEINHYHQVAKKYKKAHSVVHSCAVCLGALAAALSSAGLATALTGIGVIASVPLASVAALFGFSSAGLAAASKKLETKVMKHEKINTLAEAKKNTVSGLVSKALADGQISDSEFSIIIREVEKYSDLKAAIRSGSSSKKISQPQQPDLDKIRKEIRNEERQNLQKTLKKLSAESKLNLN
ncbi:hypothetical protein OS493_038597 [Desmophyllum pertusum]|uniref:Uncharacterized protein n=1 Tax=Desmophyllum pertusum TaxID=174260 RepID=A0A9X0CCH6_9CNID|nr:hypothetical protein OS493_038597 [Desmophyllum pertusum]